MRARPAPASLASLRAFPGAEGASHRVQICDVSAVASSDQNGAGRKLINVRSNMIGEHEGWHLSQDRHHRF